MSKRFDSAMIEHIRARVSHSEKRALQVEARRRGMSLSDFIRTAATDAARQVAV